MAEICNKSTKHKWPETYGKLTAMLKAEMIANGMWEETEWLIARDEADGFDSCEERWL